jgi:hypothetical protein
MSAFDVLHPAADYLQSAKVFRYGVLALIRGVNGIASLAIPPQSRAYCPVVPRQSGAVLLGA